MRASIDRRHFLAALPALAAVAADACPGAGPRTIPRQRAQSDHADRFRRRTIARLLPGTVRHAGAGAAGINRAAPDRQRSAIPRAAPGGGGRASEHQRARIRRAGLLRRSRDADADDAGLHRRAFDARTNRDRSRCSFARGGRTKAGRRTAARAICSSPIRAAWSSSCTTSATAAEAARWATCARCLSRRPSRDSSR